MSNRGQLRTRFRALVQEEVADQWSDAEANTLLNNALGKLAGTILQIDPEAFVAKYTADVVNATSDPDTLWWYEWPAGTLYELVVKKLNDDGEWDDLDRVTLSQARARAAGSDLAYAHMNWDKPGFVLAPPPDTAQTAGLMVEVVPTLTMSADTDIPPIAYAIHDGVALQAAIDGLAETDERSEYIEKELAKIVALIPSHYTKTQAVADQVQADIEKGY